MAIANPEGKRWQAFQADLAAFCRERAFQLSVEVVPWHTVIESEGSLDHLGAFDQPAVVRLESPGRHFEVENLLLEAGARADPSDSSVSWRHLPPKRGRLIRPGLRHRGFVRVLNGLADAFSTRPHLRPLACPRAIVEVFDKNATQHRLEALGLPCPPSIPPPQTSEELLEEFKALGWSTAYVKLATGSSASGCAVVYPLADPPWALSTVGLRKDGFVNTRRLATHRGADLNRVLSFLLAEGACVQKGMPMAQMDGLNCDVRVVAIYGEPRFFVFRQSALPMTNLHLGGHRGDSQRCRAKIPARAWLDAMDDCALAASSYPCATVGIDLLFTPHFAGHVLLEINAFGDFFPGLKDDQGRSIHQTEIETLAQREGW